MANLFQQRIGNCHLCGTYGKLSFEHVPPKSAFNDKMVVYDTIMTYDGKEPSLHSSQRGIGAHTLCESCNSKTGHWYGTAFAEWAQQGLEYQVKSRGKPSLFYPYTIYPLRVTKQILIMLFSVNNSDFQNHHQDLVRFVLNRESNELPDDVRVYTYYSKLGKGRIGGFSSVLKADIGASITIFGEIAWMPFGYVITIEEMPPELQNLYGMIDITYFARFGYRERDTKYLRLPVLETNTPFPMDYRNEQQVQQDYMNNLKFELTRNGR